MAFGYLADAIVELDVYVLPTLYGEIRHTAQLSHPNLIGYLLCGCYVCLPDLGHRRFYDCG